MSGAELAAGALGGLAAFAGLLWVIAKGIIGQVRSIDDNTASNRELSAKIDRLADQLGGHETRISRLEGREGRRIRQQ